MNARAGLDSGGKCKGGNWEQAELDAVKAAGCPSAGAYEGEDESRDRAK